MQGATGGDGRPLASLEGQSFSYPEAEELQEASLGTWGMLRNWGETHTFNVSIFPLECLSVQGTCNIRVSESDLGSNPATDSCGTLGWSLHFPEHQSSQPQREE